MTSNISEEFNNDGSLKGCLKSELVHKNALLLYIENERNKSVIDVVVRFIKDYCIQDHYLTQISADDYKTGTKFIEISPDSNYIAVYKWQDGDIILHNIYSLNENSSVCSESVDCAYKTHFKKKGGIYE